ncbi:conserved protein of unknown function [Kyrpidia spormannii]|uniref:Uncharacterized protein n=1 Tax=Kyrpidia spormannii TaxID=2055160 RepID=A0A6F9E3W8_9BACL|nr:conserved protein of unknown function [Kyrpidia spormannii]
MQRLQARAALTVDGHRRHRLGQPRGQPGIAPDVNRLFPHLIHAADDHIVHRRGVESVATHQLFQHPAQQIHRMDLGQTPLPPADGGADCINDHRFAHHGFLLMTFSNTLIFISRSRTVHLPKPARPTLSYRIFAEETTGRSYATTFSALTNVFVPYTQRLVPDPFLFNQQVCRIASTGRTQPFRGHLSMPLVAHDNNPC